MHSASFRGHDIPKNSLINRLSHGTGTRGIRPRNQPPASRDNNLFRPRLTRLFKVALALGIQLIFQRKGHFGRQAHGVFFGIAETGDVGVGDQVGTVGGFGVDEGRRAVADGGDDAVGGVEFLD